MQSFFLVFYACLTYIITVTGGGGSDITARAVPHCSTLKIMILYSEATGSSALHLKHYYMHSNKTPTLSGPTTPKEQNPLPSTSCFNLFVWKRAKSSARKHPNPSVATEKRWLLIPMHATSQTISFFL